MTTLLARTLMWGKFVIFLAAAGLVIYWVRFSPLDVAGHRVKRGEISSQVMGTGTLEARLQTIVSSKIPGRIFEMLVDESDEVKEGQILLRLDDSELSQQVEIARSSVEAATASVERVQAEAVSARAVQEQSKADHRRNQKLFASKSISETEMDKIERGLDVAEANVARSRAAIMEARKNLVVSQNTLDYHTARLRDTVIKAPFSGLVVRRDREPGDVVVPGTPIFLLISPETLWVSAWVDESEMNKLAPGRRARIVFRSDPDAAYEGKLVRLARETDRETRQLLVDVLVERLPANWSIGQRAEVFLETAFKKDAVLIPSRLIMQDGRGPGVFAANDGKAKWRKLQIGLRGREQAEILDGVKPGDVVIETAGVKGLREGRRVSVKTP
ncbi:MAG: efflux RND transporter periplasmic adaptor subunit [Deltaproteobacteria bacterium HGW-Deltaproteobacteria-21]|nr:MAG: efflux RND transporter periplasmic adaptor subunit [Deltaproteobacteria bacterium HGW-Deltaproteobacteria-21]